MLLGIVFTGGEAPSRQIIQQAVNGKDAVLAAADSGLTAAEDAGFRPDWIIGDMDSLDDQERLSKYQPQRVMRCKTDKDYTDTEMALALLAEKGCDTFWILGGGGGRIDHLFGIRSLFERDVFPSRWITGAADIRCIDSYSPEKSTLSLRLESGALVSVFPLAGGPWKAQSAGLKWPLNGLVWNRGSTGISNRTTEKFFSIKVIHGRFLIILPLGS